MLPIAPTLRTIEDDDLVKIASLLSNLGGQRDEWMSRFQHWLQENHAFDEAHPRGWILEVTHDSAHQQKQVVGVLADIPVQFVFNGNTMVVHNPSTWFVLPENRGTALTRQLFWEHYFRNIVLRILCVG